MKEAAGNRGGSHLLTQPNRFSFVLPSKLDCRVGLWQLLPAPWDEPIQGEMPPLGGNEEI